MPSSPTMLDSLRWFVAWAANPQHYGWIVLHLRPAPWATSQRSAAGADRGRGRAEAEALDPPANQRAATKSRRVSNSRSASNPAATWIASRTRAMAVRFGRATSD
jgi:hypothetical protein